MIDNQNNNPAIPIHDENDIQRYLREIGKYPLLSREEEIEVARAAKAGDAEALKTLINSNLRFVVNIAKKYHCCNISLLDLINEGNIGLIEAAKRFDPEKGVKFISYAVWWIRQAIMQFFAEQSGAVRLPMKKAGLLYHIGEKYKLLKQEMQRDPTLKELSEALNMEPSEIEPILRASRFSVSLETPSFDDSNYNLLSNLPDLDQLSALDASLKNALLEKVNNLIDKLDPREKEILCLRYGLRGREIMTLEEIGKRFKVSRERIRQLESRAKKKLQAFAAKKKLDDLLN